MKYHNILIPIDGSDGSKKALETGAEIAKMSNGELTLVYVDEDLALAPYGVGHTLSGDNTAILRDNLRDVDTSVERNEQKLKEAKEYVEPLYNNVKIELLAGEPAKSICEYADEQKTDLIVIGNRGLSGLKKLMLGSVSQKVVSEADCHVLVAK
ncbi:universal stress protein [Pseudalkalibacillus salsuginis]|uniref:universal stress protein n=1 Tax=Pseudalkalibacillus salsuginis TaxID=2910972 RepID=UPI001F3FBC12|nr:universal stress protein [Pseudalkalibacillus salsuginis]MCF6410297.1 universal stress protein [Pseudalkalibacillus salsuginis]